jgi:NTE family protein
MINSSSSTTLRRDLADLLLLPPLEQIEMLNWKQFDRAIDLGYRYAMQRLEAQPDVAGWSAGSAGFSSGALLREA